MIGKINKVEEAVRERSKQEVEDKCKERIKKDGWTFYKKTF